MQHSLPAIHYSDQQPIEGSDINQSVAFACDLIRRRVEEVQNVGTGIEVGWVLILTRRVAGARPVGPAMAEALDAAALDGELAAARGGEAVRRGGQLPALDGPAAAIGVLCSRFFEAS